MLTVEQLQLALTMDTLNKEHRSIIKDTYYFNLVLIPLCTLSLCVPYFDRKKPSKTLPDLNSLNLH